MHTRRLTPGHGAVEATTPVFPEGLRTTYRVEETLGAGAMGVVYLATHLALERPVALKLPTLSGSEHVERFVREGRILAGLQHPNLVRVLDAGESDGRPYIALEYVRGVTLSALACGRPLPVDVAVWLALQLLAGLGHAHAQGILHRDVKSENALVTADGVLKLGDFGLARSESGNSLTQLGTIMGTPGYMAPEQAMGEAVDARADLYSAGVVLFELLAGRLPFVAEDVRDLLEMQIRQPPPPIALLARDVPAGLADVVSRSLAKSKDERFATAAAFAKRLRREAGVGDLENAPASVPELIARATGTGHSVAGTGVPDQARGREAADTLGSSGVAKHPTLRSGRRKAGSGTRVVASRTAKPVVAAGPPPRRWPRAVLLVLLAAAVPVLLPFLSNPGPSSTPSSSAITSARPRTGADISLGSSPPGARIRARESELPDEVRRQVIAAANTLGTLHHSRRMTHENGGFQLAGLLPAAVFKESQSNAARAMRAVSSVYPTLRKWIEERNAHAMRSLGDLLLDLVLLIEFDHTRVWDRATLVAEARSPGSYTTGVFSYMGSCRTWYAPIESSARELLLSLGSSLPPSSPVELRAGVLALRGLTGMDGKQTQVLEWLLSPGRGAKKAPAGYLDPATREYVSEFHRDVRALTELKTVPDSRTGVRVWASVIRALDRVGCSIGAKQLAQEFLSRRPENPGRMAPSDELLYYESRRAMKIRRYSGDLFGTRTDGRQEVEDATSALHRLITNWPYDPRVRRASFPAAPEAAALDAEVGDRLEEARLKLKLVARKHGATVGPEPPTR